jgi:hypothetical protein
MPTEPHPWSAALSAARLGSRRGPPRPLVCSSPEALVRHGRLAPVMAPPVSGPPSASALPAKLASQPVFL